MDEKKAFMSRALGIQVADDSSSQIISKSAIGVPTIAPFADWDYYYLVEEIGWEPDETDHSVYQGVTAPRGFVTDLASVPKVLWPIMPPTSKYTHAAIIHDFHYWTQDISRKEADEIFSIGMKELNVPAWKGIAIYTAVSAFGKSAWENNARLKDQGESRFLKKIPRDPTITWDEWKNIRGVLHKPPTSE